LYYTYNKVQVSQHNIRLHLTHGTNYGDLIQFLFCFVWNVNSHVYVW